MSSAKITKNIFKMNSNILKRTTNSTNCEILNLKNFIANTSTTAKSTANVSKAASIKSSYVAKNKIGEKSEKIFQREDKYGFVFLFYLILYLNIISLELIIIIHFQLQFQKLKVCSCTMLRVIVILIT